jgi:YcaO-like protein with predicted kinase domain
MRDEDRGTDMLTGGAGGDAGACTGGRKGYRRATHRTVAPAATLDRLRPLLASMGITRVANVTGLDRIGIPVVTVCRPNSRSSAVFHGKGLDLDAAKASGVMEAAETYHAERVDLPLRLASHRELLAAGLPSIDIGGLPRAAGGGRFDPDLPLLWVAGRDLLGDREVWLPFEVVHANGTLPPAMGSGCFAADTNGLASGNHILEAICHGICEVVERDATSLWHRLDRRARDRTRVDLGTVDDDACREALDRFTRAGVAVAVWETTTDVGIASFQCLVVDERGSGAAGHLGHGAGCHPARDIALLRALTEAAQVRTTYIAGAREDLSPDDYAPATLAEKLRQARALMACDGTGRDFRTVPTRYTETFADDVAWMLGRLRAAGAAEQVAVVDLTRPELGLPVVRVVIPGLEGSDHHDGYVLGARARALLGERP